MRTQGISENTFSVIMKHRRFWASIFWFLSLSITGHSTEIRKLCTMGSESCGQCIKQHPDCAWCLDPYMRGQYRCDSQQSLLQDCSEQLIYHPQAEQTAPPQHNFPIGTIQHDGKTAIRLEPQQTILKMKPGTIHEVRYRYLPSQQDQSPDFTVQTSEFKSLGVGIDISIMCHGSIISAKQCENIDISKEIHFNVSVSLNRCAASGDIAISLGVYGYHTVSAIYVTPICGCDCEKLQNQEKRSAYCGGAGDLICGRCECIPGRGGSSCECDLQNFGFKSNTEMEKACRANEGAPICSGNGRCRCGHCECEAPHITGRLCECRNMECPKDLNDKLCGGQGECNCGICRCEDGFTGPDCSCTLDERDCLESGILCNNNGKCECGKCVCKEGFTGLTCGAAESVDIKPTDYTDMGTLEEDSIDIDQIHGGNTDGIPKENDEFEMELKSDANPFAQKSLTISSVIFFILMYLVSSV